ncbi:hypothetical protein RHMOL_Rhmol01G0270600 [Rhododendron molle]|uniref:Uncharacterized protein n=1 Tax=Rhododendron molle TaxID=49168 RepID=A0ACC0Q696_RHOML|nr:hypothetical protein RHMOL_Rhmol01G0270600 [Rhododendron molle]
MMIPAEEALQIVLEVAQRLPPVSVPLHEALGKVLAEDITAPDPLPPYPASIKGSISWVVVHWVDLVVANLIDILFRY